MFSRGGGQNHLGMGEKIMSSESRVFWKHAVRALWVFPIILVLCTIPYWGFVILGAWDIRRQGTSVDVYMEPLLRFNSNFVMFWGFVVVSYVGFVWYVSCKCIRGPYWKSLDIFYRRKHDQNMARFWEVARDPSRIAKRKAEYDALVASVTEYDEQGHLTMESFNKRNVVFNTTECKVHFIPLQKEFFKGKFVTNEDFSWRCPVCSGKIYSYQDRDKFMESQGEKIIR